MDRFEVRRMVEEEIERYIVEKDCPYCKADVPMVKVDIWPDGEDIKKYFRCMHCLKLFTEELKEVNAQSNYKN